MPDLPGPALSSVLPSPWTALGLLACALAVVALGVVFAPEAESEPAPAAADRTPATYSASEPVVVLELFTSQGCSSCPPADRLLTELGRDPELGSRVLPLSFHVDYWNYIGWTDPYSSERWSERQRDYARAFESSRVYTPQLVLDGRSECVGSVRREALARIRRELARPDAARIALRLEPGEGGRGLRAVTTTRLAEPLARAADLWIAVYETDLSTSVTRGENARHTLENDYVVRQLVRGPKVARSLQGASSETVDLQLDPSWDRSHLGVVAFLQDPQTREIHGAARVKLSSRP